MADDDASGARESPSLNDAHGQAFSAPDQEDAAGMEGQASDDQVRVTPGQESDDGEQDCGPKQVVPDPGAPTQSEIDDHNVDHLPYRSWCECCIKGKASGEPHRRIAVESKMPIIAFDYMFVLKEKIAMRHELSEEELERVQVKVLVVKDTLSRTLFAHVVKRKGVEEDGIPSRGSRKT